MKTILFTALVFAAGCSKKSPAKQDDDVKEPPKPAGSGSATETKAPPPVATPEPATTTESPAKADPTPSGPAGAALPGAVIDPALAKQPLALSLAGKSYTFKGGVAFGGSSGSMKLWLYPEVVTDCNKQPSTDDMVTLEIVVSAGPGQKYMQGHVVAVESSAINDKLKVREDHMDTLLQIDSIENKLNGRVKGALSIDYQRRDDNDKPKFDKGGGAFDVPVCNPAPPFAVPETAGATLTAKMKGKDFAAKKPRVPGPRRQRSKPRLRQPDPVLRGSGGDVCDRQEARRDRNRPERADAQQQAHVARHDAAGIRRDARGRRLQQAVVDCVGDRRLRRPARGRADQGDCVPVERPGSEAGMELQARGSVHRDGLQVTHLLRQRSQVSKAHVQPTGVEVQSSPI
jgi:hypothetical protein